MKVSTQSKIPWAIVIEIVGEAGVVAVEEARMNEGPNNHVRILRQNLRKAPGVVDPVLLCRNQDHRHLKRPTPDRLNCRRVVLLSAVAP